jgi:hypothetical protein
MGYIDSIADCAEDTKHGEQVYAHRILDYMISVSTSRASLYQLVKF